MDEHAYLVTLTARCTCKVFVEAASANDARKVAEMGDGKPHAPWAPDDVKPRTQKVERV